MARHLPTRPGWYRNPDDPRSLRYWDGKSWTGRARAQPAWVAGHDPFEVNDEELDRSVEGPVHPHELRQPVTSAAWGREWFLARRPRHAEQSWQRGPGSPSGPSRAPGPQPSAKLGPARRPLILLAALVMVAAAVVVSSVAVMSPYETKGSLQVLDQAAEASFTSQANRECAATLPKYRPVLADSVDGPSIRAAASQVDLLRQRLAAIPAYRGIEGPVEEWLQTWMIYTADQRRYADIIGPAQHLDGRVVPRSLPRPAQLQANAERRQASEQAAQADGDSSDLAVTACRLEQAPPA
ncbi:MAG TPA: DUF2510 domain-containing protein [Acidimicrobiales bacterium]|nr:DUF2510 domain-containing protein [Acidimicrobiales bacterium]